MNADSIFQRALVKLLVEVFEGPPGGEAFVLNPGDPGLLGQLEAISAEEASARPMPGKTTIAAHVDHVCFGLSLLNRWAAGEPNPFADADWNASWQRTSVSPEAWQTLKNELRQAAATWRQRVETRMAWDDMAASGSLASAAHTAYHLGAIRQIVAALGNDTSPG